METKQTTSQESSSAKVWDASKHDDSPPESAVVHETELMWPTKTESVNFHTKNLFLDDEKIALNKQTLIEQGATEEQIGEILNQPLAAGEFIDFSVFDENDVFGKEELLVNTIKAFGDIYHKKPLLGIDLAFMDDLDLIFHDNTPWKQIKKKKRARQSLHHEKQKKLCCKVFVPAEQVCNITWINPASGKSIVKVNHAFPAYRWFHAANLQLKHKGLTGRVIPFPIEQRGGNITYHMMKVSYEEYLEYEAIIRQGTNIGHDVHTVFHNSSKFSYRLLQTKRGVEKLTHTEVDKHLTNVIFVQNSYIRGVLVANAERDDLEGLEDSHYIYYI